jgi:hypothetical protein
MDLHMLRYLVLPQKLNSKFLGKSIVFKINEQRRELVGRGKISLIIMINI